MATRERAALGARIRKERERQGASIFKLAVLTGFHPNTVGLAERGAASEATIAKIAQALGVEEPVAGGRP